MKIPQLTYVDITKEDFLAKAQEIGAVKFKLDSVFKYGTVCLKKEWHQKDFTLPVIVVGYREGNVGRNYDVLYCRSHDGGFELVKDVPETDLKLCE